MSEIDKETGPIKQKEESKRLPNWCVWGGGLIGIIGCWLMLTTQLLEVVSESLEGIRYILAYRTNSIKRGDIVAIQDHHPHYVGEHIFAKRILGFPGDVVIRTSTTLRIEPGSLEAEEFTAKDLPLLKETKEGKPLTPLKTQIIPEGYVFVAGDHPRSFDSRYEEFGLIPVEKVYGKGLIAW